MKSGNDILKNEKKPCGFWSKKRCSNAALKCNSRKEFSNKYSGAYYACLKNKWMDEICSHMKSLGNKYNRCIYAFEFPDNSVYIGLTYNINIRKNSHYSRNNSQVYKHIHENNLQPELKQLTDYIDKDLASKKEGEFVEQYRNSGWNILNKVKTGGLGGGILIWNKEKCQEEALKYNTRTEFEQNSRGAYISSKVNGWLNDICKHMKRPISSKIIWIKEKCKEEALKYNSRKDFKLYSGSAYDSARRNGWLDDVCFHMPEIIKPNYYWSKVRCLEVALKCKTRTEYIIKYHSAYNSCIRNGWYDEINSCFIKKYKPDGYWNNKEKCKEEALKYNSRCEFQKKSPTAYDTARKNGWKDEICIHMIKYKKQSK